MDAEEKERVIEECNQQALDRIAVICEENGLTMEKVVRRLADALDATEVKVFNAPTYDKATGKKTGSRIKCSKKLVAWQPRLRAVELGANLLRMMPKQQVEHSGSIDHQHKHKLSPEIQDKLNEVYEQRPGP